MCIRLFQSLVVSHETQQPQSRIRILPGLEEQESDLDMDRSCTALGLFEGTRWRLAALGARKETVILSTITIIARTCSTPLRLPPKFRNPSYLALTRSRSFLDRTCEPVGAETQSCDVQC